MKFLVIVLSSLFILSGCSISVNTTMPENSSPENNDDVALSSEESEAPTSSDVEKQDAIITFIEEDIHAISELETVAFNSLLSVSGENYTDDQTMLEVINQNVLPAYKEAVTEARSLEAPIQELEKPTEQIKLTTEKFLESVQLQKEALEKQDLQVMEEANAKMMEYQAMLNEYHVMMKELADEYEITYEPLKIDQTKTI
ncbi:hypothetical protein FZC84_20435 [Rossellomorea vietnamensis]|uniref:Uncharacterized protein n=1 Tax=Rossellomorea vietnamensis TaxID=218284 RepID=A0A5D4M4B6_9BACI|nr:hypothetical protein [Rossellomorea vietnamensis]TYR96248.1 hypothetical protein FZC84_20435 [Rossellomorea vietnamensis]